MKWSDWKTATWKLCKLFTNNSTKSCNVHNIHKNTWTHTHTRIHTHTFSHTLINISPQRQVKGGAGRVMQCCHLVEKTGIFSLFHIWWEWRHEGKNMSGWKFKGTPLKRSPAIRKCMIYEYNGIWMKKSGFNGSQWAYLAQLGCKCNLSSSHCLQ